MEAVKRVDRMFASLGRRTRRGEGDPRFRCAGSRAAKGGRGRGREKDAGRVEPKVGKSRKAKAVQRV